MLKHSLYAKSAGRNNTSETVWKKKLTNQHQKRNLSQVKMMNI